MSIPERKWTVEYPTSPSDAAALSRAAPVACHELGRENASVLSVRRGVSIRCIYIVAADDPRPPLSASASRTIRLCLHIDYGRCSLRIRRRGCPKDAITHGYNFELQLQSADLLKTKMIC